MAGAVSASGLTGANSPGIRVVPDSAFVAADAAKMRGTIHIVTGTTNRAAVYISNGKTLTRMRSVFAG